MLLGPSSKVKYITPFVDLLSLGKFLTFIVHLYFFPATLTVIFVVPFFFAVTFPLELTVATFVFELFHHFTFLFVPFIFNVYFSPTYKVFLVLLREIFSFLTSFVSTCFDSSFFT